MQMLLSLSVSVILLHPCQHGNVGLDHRQQQPTGSKTLARHGTDQYSAE